MTTSDSPDSTGWLDPLIRRVYRAPKSVGENERSPIYEGLPVNVPSIYSPNGVYTYLLIVLGLTLIAAVVYLQLFTSFSLLP